MESDRFYITTAIPYVNAAPHIGHALEFVQTDVIARYQRSLGRDVALVTGADENSLKNVQAAEKQGITTAALCEKNAAVFKDMAQKIGLSFTSFCRTSVKETHWPGVQRLWQLCDRSGDIYRKKYRGLYCVGCEAFYEESELVGGVCPEHGTKPELIEEENFFFKLSRYQKQLEGLIESDQLKVLPATRKHEVLNFIKGGLKDFSISRSMKRAKDWGVPVPSGQFPVSGSSGLGTQDSRLTTLPAQQDSGQIMYVWFDALGTYLTGIGYGTNEQEFARYWPANSHVIGKGILRFHAIYWPAILLSAHLPLPKSIFVHGYITVEGQKMSKTLGNVVDPFHLIEKYGADQLRYCLLSEIPTFEDGDFSEKALVEKNNNELIANVGNLVNRTIVFLSNNFEGVVPKPRLEESDQKFLAEQVQAGESVRALLDEMKIKDALSQVMHCAKNANKYFQDNKPWAAIKEDPGRAGTILFVLINQVKDLGILVEPFMPNTSENIFRQMNIEPRKWRDLGKPTVDAGHHIGKPEILFKKIDDKMMKEIAEEKKNLVQAPLPAFSDLDLEVGQIIACEKHPDAEKLYVLKVQLSDTVRQIVSGLVTYYLAEELVGKKAVIVRNMKSAKLRGVESCGMLLAAQGRETAPPKDGKGGAMEQDVVEAIFVGKCPVGEKIVLKGSKPTTATEKKAEIDIKHFQKIKIEVSDFKVMSDGKQLVAGIEELMMKNVKKGDVR